MKYKEAIEWLRGNRSMTNMIPSDPHETWLVRIAQVDAAMMQQAYWVVKAETQDREKTRLAKLVEVYEWLFEHNSCVGRDPTLREDGQVWVVYDVDGDVVSRGRDPEEAAWGAWDNKLE